MLGGSISNKILIAMQRADGSLDSEVHCEGHVIKPDQNGVVMIPAEHVISMMKAGYVHTPPND
jgi:hypothetical protein